MDLRDVRWVAWGGFFVFLDLPIMRFDLVPDLIGAAFITLGAWRSRAASPALAWVPPLVILAAATTVVPWFLFPYGVGVAGLLHLGYLCELASITLLGVAVATTGDTRARRLRVVGYILVAVGLVAVLISWLVTAGALEHAVMEFTVPLAFAILLLDIVWLVTAFQISAGEPRRGPLPPLPGDA